MKTILLLLTVLALPVMGQRKVWEVTIPRDVTTRYNQLGFVVDALGNAVIMQYEYPQPAAPNANQYTASLVLVDTRGRALRHVLPINYRYVIGSWQRGVALLNAAERSNSGKPARIYVVRRVGSKVLASWVDSTPSTAGELVDQPVLTSAQATSSFHGWVETIRLGGQEPFTFDEGLAWEQTYTAPLIEKIRLIAPSVK
jgi:hypothetical protein